MATRKLRTSRRHITGYVPVCGQDAVPYESTLERDFIVLLASTRGIERISAQPFTLGNPTSDTTWRQYTPDFLVEWKPEANRLPWIVEVKPSHMLQEEWEIFRKKFKAATAYAHENKHIFKIFTEAKIRVPRLYQATFLRQYTDAPCNESIVELVLGWYRRNKIGSVDRCLSDLGVLEQDQPTVLTQVWRLAATHRLRLDDDPQVSRYSTLTLMLS